MFRVGDTVLIRALKRSGTVIVASDDGIFQVRVGPVVVHCTEGELEKTNSTPKRGSLKAVPRSTGKKDNSPSSSQEIDLHGLTVEEALKLLEKALNKALLGSAYELKVVHGLGTGKLRNAVHDYLRRFGWAGHFKIDDANPGVTVVEL